MDKIVHKTAIVYNNVTIGEGSLILENVILGYPTSDIISSHSPNSKKTIIGKNAIIRSGTVIYCDVIIGDNFRTGHNVLIREKTKIGDNVLVGTNSIVEGKVTIGSNVSIQSNVFIPTNTIIEDLVFIGPNAVLANDKYPVRKEYQLKGPTIRRGATIGANSTILPSVEIGEGAFVAAGAVVTKDIPPWKMAIGSPAKVVELPEDMRVLNKI